MQEVLLKYHPSITNFVFFGLFRFLFSLVYFYFVFFVLFQFRFLRLVSILLSSTYFYFVLFGLFLFHFLYLISISLSLFRFYSFSLLYFYPLSFALFLLPFLCFRKMKIRESWTEKTNFRDHMVTSWTCGWIWIYIRMDSSHHRHWEMVVTHLASFTNKFYSRFFDRNKYTLKLQFNYAESTSIVALTRSI